jgi:O-acetyl-ADP-ribose deacetylase (regulator of RNase III)
MQFKYRGRTTEVLQGDITRMAADAIVNAANEGLRGGGGVDGAIHRAGGPSIMEECRRIGRCATGSAVITTAGRLPARHVIHTVGPVWQGGKHTESALLRSCYISSLQLAEDNSLKSVAFPSISTGVYGYPIDRASLVAIGAVLDYLSKATSIERVIFVLFSESDFRLYLSRMEELLAEGGES